MKYQTVTLMITLSFSSASLAEPTAELLLKKYQQQGASEFSAAAGEQMWRESFNDRSCSSCHTQSPANSGKHQKTGKRIAPMAPSINPKRLTKERQIEKWFKRNCLWTLGRECTAQEKGNFLSWLTTL